MVLVQGRAFPWHASWSEKPVGDLDAPGGVLQLHRAVLIEAASSLETKDL